MDVKVILINFNFKTGKEVSYLESLELIKKGETFETHCLEFFDFSILKEYDDVIIRKVINNVIKYISVGELLESKGLHHTTSEIRVTHNIRKMLIANSFNFQFYPVDNKNLTPLRTKCLKMINFSILKNKVGGTMKIKNIKNVLVENIEQLNYLLELKTQVDCFISLNGGIKSSKSIWYDEDTKKYTILNEVDDGEDVLTEEELFQEDKTLIGSAMKSKNLVLYSYMLDGINFTKYSNFKNK